MKYKLYHPTKQLSKIKTLLQYYWVCVGGGQGGAELEYLEKAHLSNLVTTTMCQHPRLNPAPTDDGPRNKSQSQLDFLVLPTQCWFAQGHF